MTEQKRSTQREPDMGSDPDFLETLARGLRVLTAFDAEHPQMTLSDVSKVIDLPRATVRRALYTLEQLNYVQSDGRLFRLSPAVLKIAAAYLLSNNLSTILQPICERISRRADETCSAAVLDGQEAVIIARASPPRVTAYGVGVGYRLPIVGALGRALLTGLSEEQLDTFLSQLKLIRHTPKTTTDKRMLRRSIMAEGKRGYSYADQEIEVGYRSVAVGLQGYDGRTVAAMNIGALAERASTKKMLYEFLPLLQKEAAALRQQLI